MEESRIKIVRFGKENFDKPLRICEHMHEHYEVLYILEGKGEYCLEGVSYSFEGPDTLLLTEPGKHHYIDLKPNTYVRMNFFVGDDFIDKEILQKAFENHKVFKAKKASDEFIILKRLEQYYLKYPENIFKLLLAAAFTELTVLLANLPEQPITTRKNSLVHDAINYIEENLACIKGADEIADALFVSKSALCHSFEKDMKISIMRYVRNKRLVLARTFIKEGHSPTKVYSKCGFADYTAFYRAFKKYFDIAPSDIK